MNLEQAIALAETANPLCFVAARKLYLEADLLTLGQLAQRIRFQLNPEPVVTYAVDRNINYTNICTSGCKFCAFWKADGNREAYVMDNETLAKKLQETKDLGGTHILFQGGLNPDLSMEWHEERIGLIRSFGLALHGYSPPEIMFLSQRFGLSVEQVLERFVRAGLSSIPGGGAEILSDRVRRIVSPGKATSRQWLDVMAAAHRLGLKTSATMMFGHVETANERLAHLFHIRKLQDESGGFTAFIPWPYQPCQHTIQTKPTGGVAYLRMVAIARLILDNVPHVQASWVTQGADIGQTALLFGADDLGSTMIEENVVAAAGVSHRLSEQDMIRLIETAGFKAAQRDNVYAPVQRVA